MKKSERTYDKIIDTALQRAMTHGLEGISFGTVAEAVGMSKSGMFAHFESKEHLQLAVCKEAVARFTEQVVQPALKTPKGLERLNAYFHNYIAWISGCEVMEGCPFFMFTQEFIDRPGKVRDYLYKSMDSWVKTLASEAANGQNNGELHKEMSTEQLAFELYGIANSFQFWHRFLTKQNARSMAMEAYERAITFN